MQSFRMLGELRIYAVNQSNYFAAPQWAVFNPRQQKDYSNCHILKHFQTSPNKQIYAFSERSKAFDIARYVTSRGGRGVPACMRTNIPHLNERFKEHIKPTVLTL